MRNSDIKNQTANNDDKDNTYINDGSKDSSFDSAQQSKQKLTSAQTFNESLIKLLVLFYQIDGKVTLTEQDTFDKITESLDWRSGVSISAFINDAIHQARVAIDQQASREFLFTLGNGLKYNPSQALEYAMDITEVDGKRSDEEIELLSLLSNRVLASGPLD